MSKIHDACQSDTLAQIYQRARRAQASSPYPTGAQRRLVLEGLQACLERALGTHVKAVGAGSDSPALNQELALCVEELQLAISSLQGWMSERRNEPPVSSATLGRRSVLPQPRGVVGLVTVNRDAVPDAICQLVGALAAGNRTILLAPRGDDESSLITELLSNDVFEHWVYVSPVDGKAAAQLAALGVDGIFHARGPGQAHLPRQAVSASQKAVEPEFPGYSPAILHSSFSLAGFVMSVLRAKLNEWSRGRPAPDCLLVPYGMLPAVVAAIRELYLGLSAETSSSSALAHLVLDPARLERLCAAAEARGAEAVMVEPTAHAGLPGLKLLLEPSLPCQAVSGKPCNACLSIISYRDFDELQRTLDALGRARLLYYFDEDVVRCQRLVEYTYSEQVVLNGSLPEVTGALARPRVVEQGCLSFDDFSHLKPIYRHSFLSTLDLPERYQRPLAIGVALVRALKHYAKIEA